MRIRSLVIACALALVLVASALADWAGNDPPKSYPLGKLPLACTWAPTRKVCVNAGVYYLDEARAKVGLPAYKLPADFASLTPAEQMFVLTNLDRVHYGLRPIAGLTAKLNHDALVHGVRPALDPFPSAAADLKAWTGNWAAGFDNAPMAYEAWVWADGRAGWGHRHDVLWKFRAAARLAMGAAAGFDPNHNRAYAMLLVGGGPGYTPKYSYTWRKAVADGAGTHAYNPGVPRL